MSCETLSLVFFKDAASGLASAVKLLGSLKNRVTGFLTSGFFIIQHPL
jgi:hypothetical protein